MTKDSLVCAEVVAEGLWNDWNKRLGFGFGFDSVGAHVFRRWQIFWSRSFFANKLMFFIFKALVSDRVTVNEILEGRFIHLGDIQTQIKIVLFSNSRCQNRSKRKITVLVLTSYSVWRWIFVQNAVKPMPRTNLLHLLFFLFTWFKSAHFFSIFAISVLMNK